MWGTLTVCNDRDDIAADTAVRHVIPQYGEKCLGIDAQAQAVRFDDLANRDGHVSRQSGLHGLPWPLQGGSFPSARREQPHSQHNEEKGARTSFIAVSRLASTVQSFMEAWRNWEWPGSTLESFSRMPVPSTVTIRRSLFKISSSSGLAVRNAAC